MGLRRERAVLFFDTSRTGAGCLMRPGRPLPELVLLRRVCFGTDAGDAALAELFSAAAALRAAGLLVEAGAEQPQGRDPRFQSGRAMANAHIGVLQDWCRRHGVPWGGVYAPATAKVSLAHHGRAGKDRMIQAANLLYGAQLEAVYGRRLVHTGDSLTCDEHCADALGGAMAAVSGKPYLTRRTGGRAHTAFAARRAAQAGQDALF